MGCIRNNPRHSPRLSVVMLYILCMFIAALVLSGCSASATSPATATIQGTVTAGPTCPVETVENPCPPKLVAGREVDLQTQDGSTVATTTTDSAGHYRFTTNAGSYVVHVRIVQGQVGLRQLTAGDVTVVAGQTITLDIELETGIR
jgi:hypothetical protein